MIRDSKIVLVEQCVKSFKDKCFVFLFNRFAHCNYPPRKPHLHLRFIYIEDSLSCYCYRQSIIYFCYLREIDFDGLSTKYERFCKYYLPSFSNLVEYLGCLHLSLFNRISDSLRRKVCVLINGMNRFVSWNIMDTFYLRPSVLFIFFTFFVCDSLNKDVTQS